MEIEISFRMSLMVTIMMIITLLLVDSSSNSNERFFNRNLILNIWSRGCDRFWYLPMTEDFSSQHIMKYLHWFSHTVCILISKFKLPSCHNFLWMTKYHQIQEVTLCTHQVSKRLNELNKFIHDLNTERLTSLFRHFFFSVIFKEWKLVILYSLTYLYISPNNVSSFRWRPVFTKPMWR